MKSVRYHRGLAVSVLTAPLLLALPGRSLAQTILSNNLTNATGGTETATGSVYVADSFGTDASAYKLTSITLLLANTGVGTGTATLALYSDGGLQPGSLVGTLNSPSTYSTNAANTTFTSTGLSLTANTTYWAVLSSLTGAFDWSWTTDNTGTGAGFQGLWADTQDAGVNWFPNTSYPFQMSVTASAVTAVPEPGAIALCLAALPIGAGLLRRRMRAARPAASPSAA